MKDDAEDVTDAIDALIESGRPYNGLIPSIQSIDKPGMLDSMPPCIDGQRAHDRAFRGSNLMHDHPLLKAMREAGPLLGRPEWRDAANRYLHYFAHNCMDTPSGLFPWGEHSFWHLAEGRVGNGLTDSAGRDESRVIHDHLNQAPHWLWTTLGEINPDCVENFCEGLDFHWIDSERTRYNRHAPLDGGSPLCGMEKARACDFPRHSGHYMFDLACGILQADRGDFRQQYRRFLDYWWEKRHPSGLCPSESQTGSSYHAQLMTEQTLSLAVSLLEAADLLQNTDAELAATSHRRAECYIEGVLGAGHEPDKGLFVAALHPDTGEVGETFVAWGSSYGTGPLAQFALMLCRGHHFVDHPKLLDMVEGAARVLAETQWPDHLPMPGMDVGVAIELMVEIYEQTGRSKWLDHASMLSRKAIDRLLDRCLPRGATEINFYDSQMRVSYLIHALLRCKLATNGTAMSGNYTLR